MLRGVYLTQALMFLLLVMISVVVDFHNLIINVIVLFVSVLGLLNRYISLRYIV